MANLDDNARGAFWIRRLRKLLSDSDRARETVDHHVDSALAPRIARPTLPDLVPSPHCLGSQRLQQQERPAAELSGNDQLFVIVLECGYSRVQRTQPGADRYHRCINCRPASPRVGMRALGEKHLQPARTVPDLLDTFALRFQPVPLGEIDHTPPLHDLVVTEVVETDAPLRDQALDQLQRLRPSSTRDGPLTVWHRTAFSSGHFAPRSALLERQGSG
ncbi:hypothetical protein SRIMM317S_02499 [Streptomyces rimosus subsp. rimosus]